MYGQSVAGEVKLSAEEEEAFHKFWERADVFHNRFTRCRAAIAEGFNAGAIYVEKRYGKEIDYCQTQTRNANIRADLAVADANALREANRGLGIANSRQLQELDALRRRVAELEEAYAVLQEENQGILEDYQDLGAQIVSESSGGNVTININLDVTVIKQEGTHNSVEV